MADQYVGEVRLFAGNFAPTGWALCNGQILPIAQNTALFSLLGTTYGGDGRSTFGLPNLQSRVPMHAGQGAGLSERQLGESGGQTAVALTDNEMPRHTHALRTAVSPTDTQPSSAVSLAAVGSGAPAYRAVGADRDLLHGSSVQLTGSGNAHNNLPPVLVVTFIIALQGIFPPRG